MHTHGPDARELSAFLLELHGKRTELGYRAMQRTAFEQLRTLIPIDGGPRRSELEDRTRILIIRSVGLIDWRRTVVAAGGEESERDEDAMHRR